MPEHSRGDQRRHNRTYSRLAKTLASARARGHRTEARQLRKQLRVLPSGDPYDPGYRRLKYLRYADDHLLGFAGPKTEAEQIKHRLATFLRDDLNLELSAEKTLITHARTGAAGFLGYEITVQHGNHKLYRGRRSANGAIKLRVPTAVIAAKTAPYMKRGQPWHRSGLVNDDVYTIISTYGAEYRGVIQYYLLAGDVYKMNRLNWVMTTSLLKTLAGKHHSSTSKMAAKYQATIDTPHGPRRCFQTSVERTGRKPLIARFGGIPLKRQKHAILTDRVPLPATVHRKELIKRLLAGRCEICTHTGDVQVHQIRKLADLNQPGKQQPVWIQLMAKRRRKTLVICPTCHDTIHNR